MSTSRLLRWIALVAGAELSLRGYAADQAWACYGGALLLAGAALSLTWATRARRAALAAAIAWTALLAVDAGLGARTEAPDDAPAPPGAPSAPAPAPPPRPPPPSDAFVVLAFGGAGARADTMWPARLEAAIAARFGCPRPVAVVGGGESDAPLGGGVGALGEALAAHEPDLVLVMADPALLDDVLAEAPALRFPPTPLPGPRASFLGGALEARWQRWRTARRWRAALAAEPALDPRASPVAARYRALVGRSRRAGADVFLAIPPLALDAEAPEAALRAHEAERPGTRSTILAARAHARAVRTVAGAYGIRVIDPRPALAGGSARFLDLGRPGEEAATRIAEALAAGLAERLARPSPGCVGRTRAAE